MISRSLRITLARDGVFNVRDLGGIPAAGDRVVRPGAVVRGDALQRCRSRSVTGLHDHGVRRVLDLRDDEERDHEGVFEGADIDVRHLPVLDPAYTWDSEEMTLADLLPHRYAEILASFGGRFTAGLEAIAETVRAGDGAVAYHCAVGKDRTGLLTGLLLGALGTPRDAIVADYVLSGRAGAVQVNWLWVRGVPAGRVSDHDLTFGVWSARPRTMELTLDLLDRDHGGVLGYLRDVGLDDAVVDALRAGLLVPPSASGAEYVGGSSSSTTRPHPRPDGGTDAQHR